MFSQLHVCVCFHAASVCKLLPCKFFASQPKTRVFLATGGKRNYFHVRTDLMNSRTHFTHFSESCFHITVCFFWLPSWGTHGCKETKCFIFHRLKCNTEWTHHTHYLRRQFSFFAAHLTVKECNLNARYHFTC